MDQPIYVLFARHPSPDVVFNAAKKRSRAKNIHYIFGSQTTLLCQYIYIYILMISHLRRPQKYYIPYPVPKTCQHLNPRNVFIFCVRRIYYIIYRKTEKNSLDPSRAVFEYNDSCIINIFYIRSFCPEGATRISHRKIRRLYKSVYCLLKVGRYYVMYTYCILS